MSLAARLKSFVPRPLFDGGVIAACWVQDAADALAGRRDPLIPPTRLMFDGIRSVEAYKANGAEFMAHFRELADLRPHESVLDVGSGIGRKTLPLTQYLNASGRYEGFDITEAGVLWCQKNITSRHPNFRFQLADVYNGHYRPNGKYKASEFRFPYDDSSFDLVTLGSVFTHMMPEEVEHYLSEIARVLRPGGRSLITWFLLEPESLASLKAGTSTIPFFHERGPCRIADPADPERAVAFDESYALGRYAANGLTLYKPIRRGSWCARQPASSTYQDIVVTIKGAQAQAQ